MSTSICRAWFVSNVLALAVGAGAMAVVGMSSGCSKATPQSTRWDEAGAATPAHAASSADVKEGGAFNKFFPAEGVEGTKRRFEQEKKGFSEAKLEKDGKEIAMLSVSDTTSDPEAKSKFAAATDKVAGWPLVTVGAHQSAILVKEHYQVKVSSMSLDGDARKAWLARFDLAGLASL
jgi:hypothetical protein